MPSPPTITSPAGPGNVPAEVAAAPGAHYPRRRGAVVSARLILLLYIAIYYIAPAILTALFGAPLNELLIAPPNYVAGAIFCAVVMGATYYAIGRLRMPRMMFLRPLGRALFNARTLFAFSLVFLLLSVYFWQQFGLAYRQTGSRIGDSGSAIILLYIFQNYVLTALVMMLGFDRARLREGYLFMSGALLCILIGSVLSVQASSNVVSLAAALVIAIRLWINGNFLRHESSTRTSVLGTYVLFAFAAAGALFVGIANKRGVDMTIYLFFNDFGEIIRVFQTRLSYHYYSASFHTTFNLTNVDLSFRALDEVATNIQHRIDVLLGKPTTFNEITSIKRLNYEQIAYYFRERTGTAPGMVGSVFFYPFGIFLLPLVVPFFAAIIRAVAEVAGSRRLSLVELAFIMLFVGGILDSSIDLFNPFDTPFTKLFFVLCAYALIDPTVSERRAQDRFLRKYSAQATAGAGA